MCYDSKNIIINISKIIIFAIIISLKIFTTNAFSLVVQQDPIGIYCIKDNGVRAINEWVEIDFEGDNYLEYYYFDSNGYLIMNGFTPDGYTVNERGQWIVNGIVQRKYYQISNSQKATNDSNASIKWNERGITSNNSAIFFAIVFAIALLPVFLFIKSAVSDKASKKYKSRKNDNYNATYQPKRSRNATINNDTTVSRSFWWHLRSDTDKKGEEGEDKVAEELKYLGDDFIVLRNVNLPRTNKDPVQIDFICVSNKGIFVIEVKNWLGIVTGDYEDEIWYSQIYDIVNEQKNPIKQNEWHIDVLKRFIRQNMTFYSIIVFTNRANIEWLDKKQNRSYITNIDNLNNVIQSVYKSANIMVYSNYKSVAGYLRRFTI